MRRDELDAWFAKADDVLTDWQPEEQWAAALRPSRGRNPFLLYHEGERMTLGMVRGVPCTYI